MTNEINEENNPYSLTDKGFVGIEDERVRDNVNMLLNAVTAQAYITPYIALQRIAKVLANYHIAIPQYTFMEGDHGVAAFNADQFGIRFGMDNQGNVVKKDSDYYVYFEYQMNDEGMFEVFCEVVDDEELEELVSNYEGDSEEEDNDEDEEENEDKKAKLDEMNLSREKPDYDSIEDRRTNQVVQSANKTSFPKSEKPNNVTVVKKNNMKEETLDEVSKETLGRYIKKASHDVATKSAAVGRYADRANKARDKMKKGDYSDWQQGKKDDEFADKMFKKSWKRREGIAKATDKLTKEETINEISKQLAMKASEKAYEKGSYYYDSTSKLRRKALKSKDKGDMDAANAEQGKMSKKWKQSMKFKAYADKK